MAPLLIPALATLALSLLTTSILSPAAVAAAPSASPRSVTLPLIAHQGTTSEGEPTFFAFYTSGTSLLARATYFHSSEAAAAEAVTATMPAIGEKGTVTIDGRCLGLGPYQSEPGHYGLVLANCSGSSDQAWSRTVGGGLRTESTRDSNRYFGNWNQVGNNPATLAPSMHPVGGAVITPLTAAVQRVDSPSATAYIAGTATAGAEIRVNGRQVAVVTNGGWTAAISGLSVGSNSFEVVQHLLDTDIDEKQLTAVIDAPRESFTADAEFAADVTRPATLGGDATAIGSTIRVLDGTRQIGDDITPTAGKWSLDLPPTLGMGSHTLTVHRLVEGDIAQTLTSNVDYGNAVSIDAGKTGTGRITLAGDGATGAALVLTVEGRTYAPTVANGRWTQQVTVADPAEQRAIVTQHARGNVITSDAASINAGTEPVTPITAVSVTSAQKDGTYTPGQNVLEGRGTPGATVIAESTNPEEWWFVPMGRATVRADGSWTLPSRNWGPTHTYIVLVTQTQTDGAEDNLRFTSAPVTPTAPTPFR